MTDPSNPGGKFRPRALELHRETMKDLSESEARQAFGGRKRPGKAGCGCKLTILSTCTRVNTDTDPILTDKESCPKPPRGHHGPCP
jgi:hypothetical protein